MRIVALVCFFAALTSVARADDYVARALTSCAPLKGTSRHGDCVAAAANDICGAMGISQERVWCLEDFERYFAATVAAANAERQALKEETERKLRQLQERVQ
ncbi:MAG: hypothetical protein EOL86_14265 [Deltaproteobacteria bacterium]|nr:hypothetical protein [Deltaproteobacteria bacterium]